MKKLLCLLLTLLLIHPALAEDALDAPDAASLLSCADGTVLAVSPDLRVLRRDSVGDWALILSAEQISAACPPRFMPDAANALLLPGENGAYALLLLPDTSGQIAVLFLTGATCELTRVFADFLPTDSEMTAQWTLLSAARAGNTLYAAFSSNFATYSTYALSLADGSSFLLSDAPIRFLMSLADGQLLACVNPPISSIDETCFALLDADSGESSRLCALPAHKAYAGFALDGDSLYFTDGETIYCAAPPYDAVESVGYLPSLDTSARLPTLMVDNCYCVCNAELGFFAAQLHTAPRCTLRVDARPVQCESGAGVAVPPCAPGRCRCLCAAQCIDRAGIPPAHGERRRAGYLRLHAAERIVHPPARQGRPAGLAPADGRGHP